MKYFVLISLLLTGCGKKGPFIDPTVLDLYNKFSAEALNHGVDIKKDRIEQLTITFGDLRDEKSPNGDRMLGYCDVGSKSREVILDETFWANANDFEKEALVFHELGHCLLDRQHRLDRDTSGFPLSVMYPYLLGIKIYDRTDQVYSDYNDELFTNLNDWNEIISLGCWRETE